MAFAHLHLHTEYSLLDGANRIGPLVSRLKELGFTHAAITDHGVMYGAVDFYNACRDAGITPVIGCEMYICPDRFEKNGAAREYSHMILLCENNTGYQNLIKLVSAGFTEGFYYKPRIDYELLKQHTEGLICLSACLSGDLPKMLLEGRYDDAKAYALQMQELFGKDHYYIELMDHGIPEEKTVLPRLVRVAQETGLPMVVTNDCHYLNREDSKAQEVLLCIQTGKTLQDETRMRMNTEELYVKSEAEMRAVFPNFPEAIENSQKIAERCHVTFDFGHLHLPHYPIDTGETAEEMLRRLCGEGLKALYPDEWDDPASEPCQRLEYELSVISHMGYVDYFLIVWDFINYAKSHGIMVGPGRGSGAGSIVAYTLRITMLDPLKYSLLFERFLNPERVSMPDLDIDFCYERRQEVIDYVARKYGSDHVSQIITFGTMSARAVVRDVGRVLGYPYAEVDAVSKSIPFELNMTLARALEISPELKKNYQEDARVKRLIDTSRALEGLPRHASTHAAGVLITDKPVTDYVPLQRNDEVITTQFPMGTIEKLGLLKMDFLGLRTLTVIRDALDLMRDAGVDMKAEDIPLDDQAVYDMISEGETDGVFQLESGGMRSFLSNMKPQNFEDIIAAISLYRPGPMDSIPRYIEGKNNPGAIHYLHPKLKPILDVTYGCMVYQEQVMQIVRDLAGYSYGRSDLVRRAMAKKKHDVMAKEREIFIHGLEEDGQIVVPGCVRNGVSAEIASQLFDEMTAFASYAFNKSHAAAYGVVAVRTGWLKRHYPVQFFAALLNSVSSDSGKVAAYSQYCRKHGIPLLPPDINQSVRKFSVGRNAQGVSGIRFGLGAIKSCGDKAIDSIIAQRRKGGPYKDIFDFCQRMDSEQVNKRVVESLILSGAMDCTGAKRTQLMAVYESALDGAAKSRRSNVVGQMSLFGDGLLEEVKPTLPDIPEYNLRTMLSLEKNVTGLYISGHPLGDYSKALSALDMNTARLTELLESPDHGLSFDGQRVRMGGMLTEVRQKATKAGNLMGFATLEDLTGTIEALVFPRVLERVSTELMPDTAVVLSGRLSIREEEEPKLMLDTVEPLYTDAELDQMSENGALSPAVKQLLPGNTLYLRLPSDSAIGMVQPILQRFSGRKPVVLYIESTGAKLRAPQNLFVSPTQELVDTLSDMLGAKNVVLK